MHQKPQKAPRMRSLPINAILKAQQHHLTSCNYITPESYDALPPRRYDNVPTKPLLPSYDNLPVSMLQYDNAPIGHKRWVHDHNRGCDHEIVSDEKKLDDSGISVESEVKMSPLLKRPQAKVAEETEENICGEEQSAKVHFEETPKPTEIRRRSRFADLCHM